MFDKWLEELLQYLPLIKKISENETEVILQGVFILDATIQGLNIKSEFSLKMLIYKNFPEKFPKIYSADNKLKQYPHVNPDGELCLGVFLDNYLKLQHNPGLKNYFKILVEPYLYSFEFYKTYHIMPFGERSHGYEGIYEFYYEYLDAHNDKEFSNLFFYVIRNDNYRGHLPCPCGSGKITRNCHATTLKKIFNEKGDKAYSMLLTKDMEDFINYVKSINKK